jgi:hypothetical protein
MVTTLRATKAIGPTELKQRLLALFLGTEAVHEIVQTHPGLKLNFTLAHRVSLVPSVTYNITGYPSQ